MTMRSWRLSSQVILWKHLWKQWKNFRCRGIVEINFIINFHVFPWFFGVGGDFEILIEIYQWIQGVGDSWDRVLGRSIVGSSGRSVGDRGIAESNFIINCSFWIFLFFGWQHEIALYQWPWGVGNYWSRRSGRGFWGNSGKTVGGREIVESNFITSYNFVFFLGGGGGGMKIVISQRIWGVGNYQARILCGSIWRNSGKRVGGRGVIYSKFIINFHVFLFFGIGGDFETLITIHQWLWVFGDFWDRELGGNIIGICGWSVGGR